MNLDIRHQKVLEYFELFIKVDALSDCSLHDKVLDAAREFGTVIERHRTDTAVVFSLSIKHGNVSSDDPIADLHKKLGFVGVGTQRETLPHHFSILKEEEVEKILNQTGVDYVVRNNRCEAAE